jgi:triacylglycerol esterase/lipase EstA (alpha/beta hydrolase family)
MKTYPLQRRIKSWDTTTGGRTAILLPQLMSFLLVLALTGCAGRRPIGADQVPTRMAYQQVEKSVLSSGRLSAGTVSLLHRQALGPLLARDPGAALSRLHEKALATGDRDLLFALAELSYFVGDRVRESVKPWEPRDARDYYLGSAVYAYLFLFGDAPGAKPDGFDRRFRLACDLYNHGLGWALGERRGTNAAVRLEAGTRRLPVGELQLSFTPANFPWPMEEFEQFLMADQFRVRGVSVRNRDAGLGAPLIAVSATDPNLHLHRSVPATAFLRVEGSLADFAVGKGSAALELYSVFDENRLVINGSQVPLETDLTTARAHTLNQSFAWQAQRLQFFSLDKALKSQLLLSEPYRPGRVPVVLVHGTFSSPVKWAEMLNTLNADPVLRERCQIWLFLYSSSKPLGVSANELRDALASTVERLDLTGQDPMLQQMVVIGHSQGGLLTKLTVTDTGDQLWRIFSDLPLEELSVTEEQRDRIRSLAYYRPLPFVKRVIFISTPHRGSYQARGFVRTLTRSMVAMPRTMVQKATDLLTLTEGVHLPEMFRGKMPNSIDGMSPDNPLLLTLSEIPVAPGIAAHSIIPVLGKGDLQEGRDGVVTYQSAHVDYVASEFIVRGPHSCQSMPPTIEEVRRILHEHLAAHPKPGKVFTHD